MMTEPIITVEKLSRTFQKGKVKAVKNISFSINKNEIFGLIGPDGAGKTSIFRILTTLLLPDTGFAHIAGYDMVKEYKKIRQIIGYMPGKFSLYQDLTVEENLHFFASIYGTNIDENYHLIEDIYNQLSPFKDRKAGNLSGGMKQKLALSCALIHNPTIMFLDEPTTGVDPVSRKEFWVMLSKLKRKGITILVSTPYMDEASLCDRVALIQDGNILSIDQPGNITKQFPRSLYSIRSNQKGRIINYLRMFKGIYNCYVYGENIHFNFEKEDHREMLVKLKKNLQHKNLFDDTIRIVEPSIEDCFIEMLSGRKSNAIENG